MLNYYKKHKYDNYYKDIYDGSIRNKIMNKNEMLNNEIVIGISFCFDGLDLFSSGNNNGFIFTLF